MKNIKKLTVLSLCFLASILHAPLNASQGQKDDCSSLRIGQNEVHLYEMKYGGHGVFKDGDTPPMTLHPITVSKDGKEVTVKLDVHGFSSDPAFYRKNVVELMKAHQIEELAFDVKLGSNCYYEAKFEGGHIQVIVQ
jgi:hypothetical protein